MARSAKFFDAKGVVKNDVGIEDKGFADFIGRHAIPGVGQGKSAEKRKSIRRPPQGPAYGYRAQDCARKSVQRIRERVECTDGTDLFQVMNTYTIDPFC